MMDAHQYVKSKHVNKIVLVEDIHFLLLMINAQRFVVMESRLDQNNVTMAIQLIMMVAPRHAKSNPVVKIVAVLVIIFLWSMGLVLQFVEMDSLLELSNVMMKIQ